MARYYGESGSAFDVDEIAGSLQATGIRFDYIIFDDCFMSNIETLYVMRNTARYILASPCEVMDKGFPYQYVIPALLAPEALLEDRLQQVCEKYYDFYLTFPPACRFNTPSFYSWYSRPLLIPIDYYSGVTCSAPSDVYPSENRQTEWWQATH